MSAQTAGIPKPAHSSPLVPELIPLSVALPIMGVALWCIWAAHTTPETLEAAAPTTTSPEVAADAAVSPEVMTSAAVSPEVVAPAVEPSESAAFTYINNSLRRGGVQRCTPSLRTFIQS